MRLCQAAPEQLSRASPSSVPSMLPERLSRGGLAAARDRKHTHARRPRTGFSAPPSRPNQRSAARRNRRGAGAAAARVAAAPAPGIDAPPWLGNTAASSAPVPRRTRGERSGDDTQQPLTDQPRSSVHRRMFDAVGRAAALCAPPGRAHRHADLAAQALDRVGGVDGLAQLLGQCEQWG